MTAAIFGLIGVLLGGLITVGSELLLQRRHEKADARAGLRLIEADLFDASAAMKIALKTDWWAGGRPVPAEGWREHRAVLAGVFTRAEWQVIGLAMSWVTREWTAFDAKLRVLGSPEGTSLSQADRHSLETAMGPIRTAQALIETHAGPWHVERRRGWRGFGRR